MKISEKPLTEKDIKLLVQGNADIHFYLELFDPERKMYKICVEMKDASGKITHGYLQTQRRKVRGVRLDHGVEFILEMKPGIENIELRYKK